MKLELRIFPIGDLHIESLEQSKIFADYLNSRTEDLVVLLGDAVHIANSIWNSSFAEMSEAEQAQNLEEDVSIWEDFVARLKVPTIYYLGSHELFAFRVLDELLPSRRINFMNEFVSLPKNLQKIKLGPRTDPLFLTGLHIPDNLIPSSSEKFLPRKREVEEWIEKKTKKLNIPEPRKTILCTHDPCDFHYRNLGYRGLTKMLEKWPFKVHYHAHIHSNIRQTVIGETPSENRSFVALSKFNPQALEPSTSEIRTLYGRDI